MSSRISSACEVLAGSGCHTCRMVCRFAKSVMEAEGVTDAAIVVAEKGKSLLLSQLNTWCLFWDIVTSLRVKLLFLTTVSLMLLLLSCFLDPLLTLEEDPKQPGELVTVALISSPGLQPVSPLSLVNATTIAHASVDPSEQEEQRIVAKALHYATLQAAHLQAAAKEEHRRLKTDGLADPESRLPWASKPEGWEQELSGSLYRRHWAEFQKLLSDWADKKRFEPQVMEELLDQVKEPLDQYYQESSGSEKLQQESTQRYKTCAVVGNSGVLLTASHGSFIDSHDMVIRINMATLRGYTSHVGSKTNLSFINSNILHSFAKSSCHVLGRTVPIAAYMCTPVHLMDVARCRNQRTVPLLVTDPRFDMLCYRIVKWYSLTVFAARTGLSIKEWSMRYGGIYFHYSSGFQAVMLALGMCENVDLFGFGKMPGVRHHYHSKQKEELSLHDYEAEYMFYDDVMHNRAASIPFLQDSGITVPPLRIFV